METDTQSHQRRNPTIQLSCDSAPAVISLGNRLSFESWPRAGHSLIAVSKASYRDGEMVGVHLDWRKEYRESWYRTESGYVCEDVSRRY